MTNLRIRVTLRRGMLACAAGAMLSLLTGGLGIRQDEFACEDAVAHMDECCPGQPARVLDCTYSSGCGTTHFTDLTVAQSLCLRQKSCDDLRAQGACDPGTWQQQSTCTMSEVCFDSSECTAGTAGKAVPGCYVAVPQCK